MLAHSLLSGALLLLPVAVTVGIYIGVEFQRIFHGGFHGYGVPTDLKNATIVQTNTYCQKAFGITPAPGRYTYNPNQWGLSANEASSLCMNITTGTSVSTSTKIAAPFSATWQYPQGPDDEPVHAFPNAKLDTDQIPIQLSSFAKLNIDVAWHYGIGNSNATQSADAALSAANLNANVCVDMFFAADKSKAGSTTDASYEVMVWLGQYGLSTQPIGLATGPVETQSVNGTNFNLYFGTNGLNQKVFTWIAEKNMTRFVGDISKLIDTLSTHTGPQSNEYLGYVAFGSETLWAPKNMTFSVPELSFDITQG